MGLFAITDGHSQHVNPTQHRSLKTTGIALVGYRYRLSDFELLLILDGPVRPVGMQLDIGTIFAKLESSMVVPNVSILG